MIDLQEIKDFLFCSLWFYLKHHPSPFSNDSGEAVKLPAHTTLDLPGRAVTQALGLYVTQAYTGSFQGLVHSVWEAWFRQKGVGDDVLKALPTYAGLRNGILGQFLSGRITNKERRPYVEPRMTSRYKSMMDTAGLGKIASWVDEKALARLESILAELPGVGPYSLADAYADSLVMASGYIPPARESIYGLHAPVRVELPDRQVISATADLIILGAESTTIEVHDFSPSLHLQRPWIGRRLEVIAGLQMVSADPEKPFPKVERVVYRHFMTGKIVERRSVRPARLVFALETTRRGIEAGIYVPQYLSGDLARCRQCPAQSICITPNGDLTEWFLPGEAERSARLARLSRQVGPLERDVIERLLRADPYQSFSDLLSKLNMDERNTNHE